QQYLNCLANKKLYAIRFFMEIDQLSLRLICIICRHGKKDGQDTSGRFRFKCDYARGAQAGFWVSMGIQYFNKM
ncbi:hypothetical protein, partial [Desulfofundulus sp.]|uniref:hypothetical protein n=1 Tax=Desulfofundulus sp. TaxID=2282750 RepID=UPI003C70E40A